MGREGSEKVWLKVIEQEDIVGIPGKRLFLMHLCLTGEMTDPEGKLSWLS